MREPKAGGLQLSGEVIEGIEGIRILGIEGGFYSTFTDSFY